jgi:hypothetical protein
MLFITRPDQARRRRVFIPADYALTLHEELSLLLLLWVVGEPVHDDNDDDGFV